MKNRQKKTAKSRVTLRCVSKMFDSGGYRLVDRAPLSINRFLTEVVNPVSVNHSYSHMAK